jgi:hypothetical protein
VTTPIAEAIKELAKRNPKKALLAWLDLGVLLCEVLPEDSLIERGIIQEAVEKYQHVVKLAAAMGRKLS